MSLSFMKDKIATKVVLAFMLVILVPTTAMSVLFFLTSSNVVKENVRQSSLQIAKQAADSLSYIFSTGSDMSDLVYSNEKLQEIMIADLERNITNQAIIQNNEYADYFLNSNIYSSSFVRIIYVLKEEGTSWGSGTFSSYKLSQYNLEDLNWVQRSLEKDGQVIFEGLQYDRFSGAGENTNLILPIGRVMKDFNNLKNIGYLLVCLDGKAIIEKIESIKLGKTGGFFVVNEKGEIVIHSDLTKLNKPVENRDLFQHIVRESELEFEFKDSGILYYGVKQPISNGWTIVGTVPIKEITNELSSLQKITISSFLFLTIIAIIIGFYITKMVTKPIQQLTDQMKLVGAGDFSVRTKVISQDEIGLMSLQFNRMINQVQLLLNQVKEEELQKQEAEMRAIKHRINPHFLFNTLSTIRWLVKLGQTEKANTALSALSLLLEANMGKNGTFITVREELDIVVKFIDILQIRYDQAFDLKVNIEPIVEDFLIPRMLLQPLVENSIFHGIVPSNTNGCITVSGVQIEGGVEIHVKDNGIGFNETNLSLIQTGEPNTNSYVGIGLKHVFDSVRLYYSSTSQINITSNENGTNVMLKLLKKDCRWDND